MCIIYLPPLYYQQIDLCFQDGHKVPLTDLVPQHPLRNHHYHFFKSCMATLKSFYKVLWLIFFGKF